MSRTIKQDYLLWLSSQIDYRDNYYMLLRALYLKEFYWTVNNDENRAEDGKALRSVFVDENGLDSIPDVINGPCNVLEMLIGLAKRWNKTVSLTENEDRSDEYFWLMIQNLGLEGCDDYTFDAQYVDEKLDIFLDRDFSEDGTGGLFPLKTGKEHQNEIEIWYQLQNYLNENFEF